MVLLLHNVFLDIWAPFSHLSVLISKTSYLLHRDVIFELKVSKGLLKK